MRLYWWGLGMRLLMQCTGRLSSLYPVRVCAAGLCIWSRWFVCVRTYIHVNKKQDCLVPYRSKISRQVYSTAISLSLNASSVVCYIQWAIQTEQFMPFQIKCGGPTGPKYGVVAHRQSVNRWQTIGVVAHRQLELNRWAVQYSDCSLEVNDLTKITGVW